ncbi:MobV family relaxase, partial [Paraclostridium sordellii]
MEFAWNAQKNKMSDVKGKELEQERKGKISNEEINLDKTYKNYDLVKSNLNLYQRIKQRVEDVRENSRIQKNSVVSYSNIITVNKETFKKWGEEKSKEYLEEVYNYFCNEFGKENVVSAKVHLDETTPHMHLHFVPISSEGKLQARK